MQLYRLTCEMRTSLSIADTFKVFEDPYNLARITPPWLNFTVTTPHRVDMARNARIEYRIRWFGIPLKWRTVIDEYDRPTFFSDRQECGPYSYWKHRHTFREVEGGTLVHDQVEYSLPFGWLGRLAHALFVRRQLLSIFEFRQRALATLFEGPSVQTMPPAICAAPRETPVRRREAHQQ